MVRRHWLRTGFAALGVALLSACSDQRSSPLEPQLQAHTVSGAMVGDTVVSEFTVSPWGGRYSVVSGLLKIDFPAGAICDIPTSSYGPSEWDKPCVPTTQSVRVKSKAWLDAQGHPHVDFQPAMRFSPAIVGGVQLYLKDPKGLFDPNASIFYCATDTNCYDESLTDASLRTRYDSSNGMFYRRIKHFSGYNVTAGRVAEVSVEDSALGY